MSTLKKYFQFIALLKGDFDGDHIHSRPIHVWHHRFMCFMYLFESMKHGCMAFSNDPQLYMYLGDVRFSENQLQRLSSLIVFLFTSLWFFVFIRSDIYSQEPWRMKFLSPIFWPETHLKRKIRKQSDFNITKLIGKKIKNHSNQSIQLSKPRLKTFINLVDQVSFYYVVINIGLFFVCTGLTFRSTYDGYLNLSTKIFWLVSVPCSLSTVVLLVFMSLCIFFFTMAAFYTLLYYVERVSDENDNQLWIKSIAVLAVPHQKRILKSLHRLDQLLKELKRFSFFVDYSFVFHFMALLMICILLPYMVLFENPLLYSLALASINVFAMLIMIWPVCVCNSILNARVSVNLTFIHTN